MEITLWLHHISTHYVKSHAIKDHLPYASSCHTVYILIGLNFAKESTQIAFISFIVFQQQEGEAGEYSCGVIHQGADMI